jgi:hypothetical protein
MSPRTQADLVTDALAGGVSQAELNDRVDRQQALRVSH